MKIVIIGAGNVGTNLRHGFQTKGVEVPLIHAREILSGSSMLPLADVYIYAVADHALAEVIAHVNAPKALHLHTSGSMPVSVFGDDKPHAGILYFFQTFSKDSLIENWNTIPVFIEGKNIDDLAAIYTLAQTFSSVIYETTQEERERLHVAGVFANNFTNLMYRYAAQILSSTTIPFSVLLPLIDQTAAKVHSIPPKDAQTGPANRRDQAVLTHHKEILDGEKRTIYSLLTDEIMKGVD